MKKNKILKKVNKNIKKKLKWFSIVELLVVIAILSILFSIAFVNYQSFTLQARDWIRLSDITNIEKSLWLMIIEKWNYPLPDKEVDIKYNWSIAWTQWTIWDNVIKNLNNINKKPVDPLKWNEYTYSVTATRNEYQIWTIQESWILGYKSPFINQAYSIENYLKNLAVVKGTYNWLILNVNTWSINYILALPSIITSDISNLDLKSIINNKLLVFPDYYNLPHSYANNWYIMNWGFNYIPTNNEIIIFSGSLNDLNKENTLKEQFMKNLVSAYSWTILSWKYVYTDLSNIDLLIDRLY